MGPPPPPPAQPPPSYSHPDPHAPISSVALSHLTPRPLAPPLGPRLLNPEPTAPAPRTYGRAPTRLRAAPPPSLPLTGHGPASQPAPISTDGEPTPVPRPAPRPNQPALRPPDRLPGAPLGSMGLTVGKGKYSWVDVARNGRRKPTPSPAAPQGPRPTPSPPAPTTRKPPTPPAVDADARQRLMDASVDEIKALWKQRFGSSVPTAYKSKISVVEAYLLGKPKPSPSTHPSGSRPTTRPVQLRNAEWTVIKGPRYKPDPDKSLPHSHTIVVDIQRALESRGNRNLKDEARLQLLGGRWSSNTMSASSNFVLVFAGQPDPSLVVAHEAILTEPFGIGAELVPKARFSCVRVFDVPILSNAYEPEDLQAEVLRNPHLKGMTFIQPPRWFFKAHGDRQKDSILLTIFNPSNKFTPLLARRPIWMFGSQCKARRFDSRPVLRQCVRCHKLGHSEDRCTRRDPRFLRCRKCSGGHPTADHELRCPTRALHKSSVCDVHCPLRKMYRDPNAPREEFYQDQDPDLRTEEPTPVLDEDLPPDAPPLRASSPTTRWSSASAPLLPPPLLASTRSCPMPKCRPPPLPHRLGTLVRPHRHDPLRYRPRRAPAKGLAVLPSLWDTHPPRFDQTRDNIPKVAAYTRAANRRECVVVNDTAHPAASPHLQILSLTVGDESFTLVNFYHHMDGNSPRLSSLAAFPLRPIIPTIVAGDFNTHSPLWSAPPLIGERTTVSAWAPTVEDWMETQGLSLLSPPHVPTSVGEVWFQTTSNSVQTETKPEVWFAVWEIVPTHHGEHGQRDTVIDLVLWNQAAAWSDQFVFDRVSFADSLGSDHTALVFSWAPALFLPPPPSAATPRWQVRDSLQDVWQEHFSTLAASPAFVTSDPAALAQALTQAIIDANDFAFNHAHPSSLGHGMRWWNDACSGTLAQLKTAPPATARLPSSASARPSALQNATGPRPSSPRRPTTPTTRSASSQTKSPDPLLYLREKWYCLRANADGKPYLGARRSEIETQIANEPPARETIETPAPIEEERPTSPESIAEPEKRQNAPILLEIKMGSSTRVEKRPPSTPKPSYEERDTPNDNSDHPEGDPDDDDNDFYHDVFPAFNTNTPDGKILGNLPSAFTGDRARAEEFLTNMQAYFRLNIKNAQMRSPMTRVALCLSTMEGPDIEEWKRDIGKWFDRLNPNVDDRMGVWHTFEREFKKQFEDSQSEPRARMELQHLEMKWPLIDKYVSDFEKLARLAGYDHTNPETMHFFMNGLPKSILTDVLQPPVPTSYHRMKAKAIEADNIATYPQLVSTKEPATTAESTGVQPTEIQFEYGPRKLQQQASTYGLGPKPGPRHKDSESTRHKKGTCESAEPALTAAKKDTSPENAARRNK
ncbi:hypothetical protein BC826DRAFT_1109376 [Russula brevipes]|nr:hypothetical protein BC826DRAFT_1109376 [Russula brevipes]